MNAENVAVASPTPDIPPTDIRTFDFGKGIKSSYPFSEIFSALVKAHGEIQNASRNETGQIGTRRYGYADLLAISEASKKALIDNGLCCSQHPTEVNKGSVTITTLIIHKSGQWIMSSLVVTSKSDDPQAIGSAITYGRRYAKQAIFDIATEDDDGAAAAKGHENSIPSNNNRPQQQQAADQRNSDRPQPPPNQGQNGRSPGPEALQRGVEQENRKRDNARRLQALKTTLNTAYLCKSADDVNLVLAYALNDRSKNLGWLSENPDQCEAVAQQISKWATESNLKPEEALAMCKATESTKEAFPS